MCGRFANTLEDTELLELYGYPFMDVDWNPNYNIAPMQSVPVAAAVDGKAVVRPMRWGLVPSWAKDEKFASRTINARAETVAEKASFRKPFKSQRCLVPATGYYEWRVLPESTPLKKAKAPMFFRVRGGEPFSFAGLWDVWKRFDGKEIVSFTIITTSPNELSRPIHDRMPVILRKEDEVTWLDPANNDPDELHKLLKPFDSDAMDVYEVSRKVNSPRNNDPSLIKRVG